jgi:hypothetical protein
MTPRQNRMIRVIEEQLADKDPVNPRAIWILRHLLHRDLEAVISFIRSFN